MIARRRYALDANVLNSIVNSDDAQHFSCYSFFRNLDDDDEARWVVPGLIFFEFQATQSKLSRKRRTRDKVYRWAPLHYENTELYHVTKKFLIKVHELDLYNKFSLLNGADLLYACIAYVEGIPLVTHDKDFAPYSKELTVIRPRDLYGTGDVPLHRGTVMIEKNGKVYRIGYEVFRGVVRLETGQATHTDGVNSKFTARLLLKEIVDSGLADRMGLGTQKS
ncbi:MAG: PIN domain-containing protein [Nitrospiraceae bacterium]